ncbi:oxygenase MpaB family protein [Mycobacterium triplex]|nr:oxygenase MpaB family protein [Mycobacterium triplex]
MSLSSAAVLTRDKTFDEGKICDAVRMARAKRDIGLTNAKLDEMRQKGDPVADRAVEAVFNRNGVSAVNAVMRTLVRVDQPVPAELPPEVQQYLQETVDLPEWADMGKIERGQQLFEVFGFQITLCLFCASLPSSYAAAKAVKVLYLTAQLDTNARRRVLETGQFLIDVLSAGSLDEDGKGRRTIQKIRLMHAAVRLLIKERGKQQPKLWHRDWGTPINQEDLLATLLVFWFVVGEPMRRLGVEVPCEDQDAYLHLWNVIGHQLGVCDELLVFDVAQANALVDLIRSRHFKASPEGHDMTRALLVLLDQLTPFHRFDDTIPPLIRHLIGDKTADLLLVPRSDLGGEVRRIERISNWFYVHVFGRPDKGDSARYEFVLDVVRPFGRDLLRGMFELERGGERAPFALPDRLARNWELST